MTIASFQLRRNQMLLAEARTNLVLATREATPRERRAARNEALELAERAKRGIAAEFSVDPEDVPWAAAMGSPNEVERIVAEFRRLRASGASSLDAWSATSSVLLELDRARACSLK